MSGVTEKRQEKDTARFHTIRPGVMLLVNLQNDIACESGTDCKIVYNSGHILVHLRVMKELSPYVTKLHEQWLGGTKDEDEIFTVDLKDWTVQQIAPVIILIYVGDCLVFPDDKETFNAILNKLEISEELVQSRPPPPPEEVDAEFADRLRNSAIFKVRCCMQEGDNILDVFVWVDGTMEVIDPPSDTEEHPD